MVNHPVHSHFFDTFLNPTGGVPLAQWPTENSRINRGIPAVNIATKKGNVYALDSQTFEIPENIQEKKDKSIPIYLILLLILGILLIIRPFLKTKNPKNKK